MKGKEGRGSPLTFLEPADRAVVLSRNQRTLKREESYSSEKSSIMMNTSRSNTETSLARPATWSALAVAVALIAFPVAAHAAQATVPLGDAQSFAVLAGEGITNTGATTVSGSAGGDMGSHPTGSFTGEAGVTTNGTKYLAAEAAVADAKAALVTAYDDTAGRTGDPTVTVSADLAGQTLIPGVYNSGSTLSISGPSPLVLDAQNDPSAVFIFQAGSGLTTDSGTSMSLINGAQACNVFWQVGSSAIFGTNSTFIGHVFALTSIAAANGASFDGQLLARNGTVTLENNTIVNDLCDAPVVDDSNGDTDTTPDESNGSTTPPAEEAPAPAPDEGTVDAGDLPETDAVLWLVGLAAGVTALIIGAIAYARNRRSA